ncbi:MAG TPA: SCO1664 family protein [Arachnia sp.]|nr:SCO1664 family protein [Arachnia sp.]HMT85059.1 SCO1664 family protein [Arachnia sp.]
MLPSGRLRVLGRLADASNGTFLVLDDDDAAWVYKPVAGEVPLWDFPRRTLSRREVAAYAISEALGLGVVPLTVWHDGPAGEGSLQRWVDAPRTGLVDLRRPEDLTQDWLPVVAGVDGDDLPVVLCHRDDRRLRAMALFDAVINNSDRKAAHVLEDGEVLRGVDHGVSLHVEPKLRTVLWGFAGSPFTVGELAVLDEAAGWRLPLADGLAEEEWKALSERARVLRAAGRFPHPGEGWPAIPWPPF